MNLRFLMTKLKQINLSMIQVEKQQKYLLYLLKIFWKNTNIWLVKIQDIDQACLKKLNLTIRHWVYHLVNHLKKIMLKILRIKRVILIMTDFAKIINEFEEMSLDSKYNKMKKFTNLLTIFKDRKPKTQKRNSKRSEL